MAVLSEWLQLMLAEIARKREDLEQTRAEEARRATEVPAAVANEVPSVAANDARPSVKEARVARR